MLEFLIYNVNIVLKDTIHSNHCLLVSNGKIKKIAYDINAKNIEAINGKGCYLCPGFIDLHIHGIQNFHINNGIAHLEKICKTLPRYGVTSFLPTVRPLPKGRDAELLNLLSTCKNQSTKICGFHLEGPFLKLTGALSPDTLGKVDPDRVHALIEAAKPYKAIFSISPDLKNIESLIPLMAQNNTPVFMTHTKANVDQTQKAINAGACHATHFYDVFYHPCETDPGVRPCGAVEAILAENNVSVDFILDGEHVDPVAVRMALKCKGPDKVCLITDANIGAGNKPGTYNFGNKKIEFKYAGAPARLIKNGELAGSGLTMNKAVKNAVEMLGVDLPLAVRMASSNPAKVLRIENIGSIEIGKQADLVLMDKKFEVIQTWVGGNCCYKA